MSSCPECGKDIQPNRKFCSKSCYGESISKSETYTCELCGQNFSDNLSANRTYCSKECRDKDRENKVTVNCAECEKEIRVQENVYNRAENNFCSQECHNNYQTEHTKTECMSCGDEFKHKRYNNRKFCSKTCAADYRSSKVTVSCSNCSKNVKRCRYYVEKYDNTFCSTECHSTWLSENSLFASDKNPNKKDGRYSGFGSNWPSARKSILKRSGNVCEHCGKTAAENGRDMSVHHIIPRSEFINSNSKTVEESNTKSNLVALCRSCHIKAEHDTIDVNYITT